MICVFELTPSSSPSCAFSVLSLPFFLSFAASSATPPTLPASSLADAISFLTRVLVNSIVLS